MSTEPQAAPAVDDDLSSILDGPEMLDDMAEPPEVEAKPDDPAPKADVEPEGLEKTAAPGPVTEPEKAPETVPLSVLIETRKDLQAQAEYWRARAEQGPKAEPATEELDFVAEPDRALSAIDQRINAATTKARNDLSLVYAQRHHGEDTVQTAFQALQASGDQAAVSTVMASVDPYGEMVKWHQRAQVLAEIGDDPAAYRERIRREAIAEIQAQQTVKAVKGAPQPAGSLADGPNLGQNTATQFDLDDISALIGKGG